MDSTNLTETGELATTFDFTNIKIEKEEHEEDDDQCITTSDQSAGIEFVEIKCENENDLFDEENENDPMMVEETSRKRKAYFSLIRGKSKRKDSAEAADVRTRNYQTMKRIIGDGNSLFRCLGFRHYGNQRCCKKLRTEIVLYVVQNWNDFEPLIVGDSSYGVNIKTKQEYASHMSKDGTSGGEVEIFAFVKIYPEYCISVFFQDCDEPKIIYGQGDKHIYLKYYGKYGRRHYDILILQSNLKHKSSKKIKVEENESKKNEPHVRISKRKAAARGGDPRKLKIK